MSALPVPTRVTVSVNVVLLMALRPEPGLLNIIRSGPLHSVWVSVMCRPRLLDKLSLLLFRIALQFRGTCRTSLRILVRRVVLIIRRGLVL